MSDVLTRWNRLSEDEATKEILPCCGSTTWARGMVARRPIPSEMDLLAACDEVCQSLTGRDWNEAFLSHPRIGESRAAGQSTSRSQAWSGKEQGTIAIALEHVKLALAAANCKYEERFGRIFIVCATGKSGPEILETLRRRLRNDDVTEFREAAEEQRKIARLRLRKWLVGAESKRDPSLRSGWTEGHEGGCMKISTHVLDLVLGKPAKEMPVRLDRRESAGTWTRLNSSCTDGHGRCDQLMPENESLRPGIYRLAFDTASYHLGQNVEGLYPVVEITFQVREGETHFHIPLLLSPYGYTTYRGS